MVDKGRSQSTESMAEPRNLVLISLLRTFRDQRVSTRARKIDTVAGHKAGVEVVELHNLERWLLCFDLQ